MWTRDGLLNGFVFSLSLQRRCGGEAIFVCKFPLLKGNDTARLE